MTVSTVSLLFCLHLGIVIGQLNSTRDTLAERKLQGPLLILEVPLFLGIFGTGTAVAEGGAVAVGVGAVAEGGAATAAVGAAGAAGATAAAEGVFTVASLAGVTISLAEGAFFAVDTETLAMVETLLETNAAGEVTALTRVGKAVAQEMALLDVCLGVVADLGDVFSEGTVAATEDATASGKKFVDGGGEILQGAKVQKEAAMGAAKTIQETPEKVSKFLKWAMEGAKQGFVGPKTKSAIKPAMAKASTINKFALVRGTIMGSPHSNVRHEVRLWLLGPAVMGIAAITMGVVWRYLQQSRSHADEDMQPLRKP